MYRYPRYFVPLNETIQNVPYIHFVVSSKLFKIVLFYKCYYNVLYYTLLLPLSIYLFYDFLQCGFTINTNRT